MTPTPLELLKVARMIARETGEMVVAARRDHVSVAATKSSDIDVVTHVDLAAESLLRSRLAELRPNDGILGEEGADTVGTSGITWVLDPIDGTVNFLYGLPSYSVSVAAVSGLPNPEAWNMEAGAVYEGGTQTLWSAARGEGAWRGDVRLRKGPGPALSGTLLGTGFQYIAERRAIQGDLVAKLLPQVRDIRRLGSCAMDICLVASGGLDAYYEHGLNSWDFAAAALIAREAGVRVEGLNGAPPNCGLTIAAAPESFEALHEALVAAGAAKMWDTP